MIAQGRECLSEELSKEFWKQLPENVIELIGMIQQAGFNLTLVGGAVRDFLLLGEVSKDLDFQLGHRQEYTSHEWSKKIKNLGDQIVETDKYSIEFLRFSILRILFPNSEWDVELAPARIEHYSSKESYGHSDVRVELVSNSTFEETFRRRDFSINAIGIDFASNESKLYWVDPYRGREALNKKRLETFNPHFSKDPVRFCRAIRFSLKFDLEFDQALVKQFKDFNLIELSTFYFFKEAAKVGYFNFFKLFFKIVNLYQIPINPKLIELNFLINYSASPVASAEELVAALVFETAASEEELGLLTKAIAVKTSYTQNLFKVKSILKDLENYNKSNLKELINKDISSFIKSEELSKLISLHQLLYKKEVKEVEFKYLDNSNVKDFKQWLPETLLGKEEFLKLLKRHSNIGSKDRRSLQYYGHFQSLLKKLNF